MISFQKFIVWFFCLIFLSSCSHISDNIHEIPIKSSRVEILKLLGRPNKIQRKNGKDHWTYKFSIEGRHFTRVLILTDGMLYRKGKLKPYPVKSF